MNSTDKSKILSLIKHKSIYAPYYDAKLFRKIINELAKPFLHTKIDKVVGLDARGFILGSTVAYKLKCGFVVARKKGKMFKKYTAADVYSTSFVDYSNKKKSLELAKHEGVQKGDHILVVDDRFSTGTQGKAIIKLLQKKGAKIVGFSIMLNELNQQQIKYFSRYNLKEIVSLPPKK